MALASRLDRWFVPLCGEGATLGRVHCLQQCAHRYVRWNGSSGAGIRHGAGSEGRSKSTMLPILGYLQVDLDAASRGVALPRCEGVRLVVAVDRSAPILSLGNE